MNRRKCTQRANESAQGTLSSEDLRNTRAVCRAALHRKGPTPSASRFAAFNKEWIGCELRIKPHLSPILKAALGPAAPLPLLPDARRIECGCPDAAPELLTLGPGPAPPPLPAVAAVAAVAATATRAVPTPGAATAVRPCMTTGRLTMMGGVEGGSPGVEAGRESGVDTLAVLEVSGGSDPEEVRRVGAG